MHSSLLSRLLPAVAFAVAAWSGTADLRAQGGDGQGPRVLPAPPGLLQQFDVMVGTVQSLTVPQAPGAALIEVVLGGATVQLELQPHDVRSPAFQLFERTAAGLQLLPTPPSVTYRGGIAGEADSIVAATIDGGSVCAYVLRGDETWVVQPVREVNPAARPSLHVVYRGADGANLPFHCGVQGTQVPVPEPIRTDVVFVCDLAIEADFPFYQANGSNTTATQNDVMSTVNAIDVIYRRDVDITYNVTQLIVNSAADPYTTNQPGTLLNQFANHWNNNHGGIVRDVAHLYTGRPMGQVSGGTIGIATLGTVCSIGSAYGVSQSRFTSNFAYRVAVTAHELGHNWNANHCDSSPPCNIMCSGVGGCANQPGSFSLGEQNEIVTFRQSRPCLVQQITTPSIGSITPIQVKTFRPPLLTVNGNGLTGVNQITVGSAVVNSGITVLSDNQLRFTPPEGLPLGVTLISATNSAGTSNTAGVIYTATNPCEVAVPPGVIGGTTVEWDMGGTQNDFAFLVLSLANTTSPLQGFPVLNGFSVIWAGGLDTVGMASFSLPVPAGVLNGLRVYSQLLDIQAGTLNVRSVSTTPSTLIVF
jgi:hypothetical protein